MTMSRSTQRSLLLRSAATLLALVPVATTPTLARPRHAPHLDSFAASARDLTARVPADRVFIAPGRSMRSSTLGNAEFPERDPIQQNLGNTSGGGVN